jgi:diadenosine tetraphosphate (Ap4A) HIT family hydrolase
LPCLKGRWHDNRHTLVTELAESGAGDEVIMGIAGQRLARHALSVFPCADGVQAARPRRNRCPPARSRREAPAGGCGGRFTSAGSVIARGRNPCPFCAIERDRLWIENEHALAVPDANPTADGHTVVVPRKHVNTIYELTIPEQQALWDLVSEVRQRLLTGLTPDGLSIGFSDTMHDGVVADHAAVHLVPRRHGDNPELRAGIEWVTDDPVLPSKK